jgi:hypothetical protein
MAVFTGCVQHPRPVFREVVSKEHVFRKNYQIGDEATAFVGEPVLKVRDYNLLRYSSTAMRASHNFSITWTLTIPDSVFYGKQGQLFVIYQTPNKGEDPPQLWLTPKDASWGPYKFWITDDGKIKPARALKVEPPELAFTPIKDESIAQVSGYTNYELIYGGNDGESFTLAYREFSPDNIARTAFYQDLRYSMKTNEIRFKDTIIQVHSVDNEKIVYTVLEDSHDQPD